MLPSNLLFSDWETIFKDPMTTAAAIDRLVHHSVILELNLTGYRFEHKSAQMISQIIIRQQRVGAGRQCLNQLSENWQTYRLTDSI